MGSSAFAHNGFGLLDNPQSHQPADACQTFSGLQRPELIVKDWEGLSAYYRRRLEETDWAELRGEFLAESKRFYHVRDSNPLFEVFRAGVFAYPQFVSHIQCLDKDLQRDETLGLSLDLPEGFSYHSTIVCPVSKELCTADNPPVALACGHVISDASAKKLAQMTGDLQGARKFKCPVCPEEQMYSKVRVLRID